MKRAAAVQVFSVLAVLVGLVVSYFPPAQNGMALWALVSMFLGYAVRDLFGEDPVSPRGATVPVAVPAPAAMPAPEPIEAPNAPEPVASPQPIAAPPAQAGRAMPVLLLFLAIAAALAMGGCASLENAGNSSMTLKPFVTDAKSGATVCCEVSVADGKQRASLTLSATKTGNDYAFSLDEKGVEAFQGQAIAAGASKGALDAAAKAAVAAALAPVLPALMPAAGAALASPGIGAAAAGAATVLGTQQLIKPAAP